MYYGMTYYRMEAVLICLIDANLSIIISLFIKILEQLVSCAVVMANYCTGIWLPGLPTNHKAHCKTLYLACTHIIYYCSLFWQFICFLTSENSEWLPQSLRKPNLFWVSAAAPLTSVILSTILVFLLRNKAHNIAIVRKDTLHFVFYSLFFFNTHKRWASISFLPNNSFLCCLFFLQIGELPKGLNPPSSNMLFFSGPYLALAIKTGIVTGILSLTVSCPKPRNTIVH